MRILDPGHRYELASLDGDSAVQVLQFVKREGSGYPGNVGHYPGTTSQEVLRCIIDRAFYTNNQIPCWQTWLAARLAGFIVWLFEHRAAKRHRRTAPGFFAATFGATCVKCGHVGCEGQCHRDPHSGHRGSEQPAQVEAPPTRNQIPEQEIAERIHLPKRTSSYLSWLVEKLKVPQVAENYLRTALDDSLEAFLVALRNVAEARAAGSEAQVRAIARDITVTYDLHCEQIDDPDPQWLEDEITSRFAAAPPSPDPALVELRELSEKATLGPWSVLKDTYGVERIWDNELDCDIASCAGDGSIPTKTRLDNAAFIVACVNYVRAALEKSKGA